MKQNETHKADLLEHFYEHLTEEDWLEGVDLYQAGRVVSVQNFNSLVTGKVTSFTSSSVEVRLKTHPSGRVIQWIECTCKKNRTHGYYCEHIAAFMIHIEREKGTFIKNLDFKMPLKPPSLPKRRKKTPTSLPASSKPNASKKGASQTLLNHLKGSIQKVSLANKGPSIKIKIEIKPGTMTNYTLDVDASAQFLENQKNLESYASDVKSLKVSSEPVKLGTRIYSSGEEKITAERVAALRLKAKPTEDPSEALGFKSFYGEYSLYQGSAETLQTSWYLFIPIKSANKLIGKDWFFVPKSGYHPLDRSAQKSDWYELPLSKTFKDDEAAKFLQSGFAGYAQTSSIWLDSSLKQPDVRELSSISEVKIHTEEDGWFHLDPTYGLGDSSISMVDLLIHAKKKKRKFIKTGDSWLKIPDFITQHDWNVAEDEQMIKVDALGLMRLKASLGDFDHFVGSKQILEKIRNQVEYNDSRPIPSLSHTKLNLRSYQLDGLKWFWWLFQNQLHGLLADDMGLGKTHQAMGLMSAIQKVTLDSETDKQQTPKFLVICPTTVLDHWDDKVLEFAPNLRPLKYHGPKRISKYQMLNSSHDTLITSYGVLLRDIKKLCERKWAAIILDEAHYVKNNNTATYRAACRLDAGIRICLTGTPMENHLGELKNLFDFLVPGYLGSDEYFKKHFILPIEQDKSAETELALQKLIHPLKLRRGKKQVLEDLPEKIEDIRHCSLSNEQIKLYRDVINLKAKPLLNQLSDDQATVPYIHVFAILQMLKQVCNHPALLKDGSNYTKHESGKFELLKGIISEALDSDNKIVIFSQYVGMIKIIEQYCLDQNIEAVSITGQTRNRGKIIERFQKDPNVKIFIGSLLAGGVGIDLTAASVVIHYDRWWNASKENQATDRVHRIGQKKFVQVMKLVTKGTLEEKIDKMISKKQSMFTKFLDQDEEIFKSLTRKDLIELLQ